MLPPESLGTADQEVDRRARLWTSFDDASTDFARDRTLGIVLFLFSSYLFLHAF